MLSVNFNFLYFPPWDSIGLLVCYRAHFSVLETVLTVCVAICLRLPPCLIVLVLMPYWNPDYVIYYYLEKYKA